jgi:hypothetical protein
MFPDQSGACAPQADLSGHGCCGEALNQAAMVSENGQGGDSPPICAPAVSFQ